MHCGAEVTESSTNKQHHLSLLVGEVVHVSVLSIFAFALLLLTYVWLHSLSVSLSLFHSFSDSLSQSLTHSLTHARTLSLYPHLILGN